MAGKDRYIEKSDTVRNKSLTICPLLEDIHSVDGFSLGFSQSVEEKNSATRFINPVPGLEDPVESASGHSWYCPPFRPGLALLFVCGDYYEIEPMP